MCLAPTIENRCRRVSAHAHRTPILKSRLLDEMLDAEVFFKCENFQKVGAFKFRGACNAVYSLSPDELERGVATHSSGNHAGALAMAAQKRGIRAYIVMPNNAPKVKQARTRAEVEYLADGGVVGYLVVLAFGPDEPNVDSLVTGQVDRDGERVTFTVVARSPEASAMARRLGRSLRPIV